MLNKPQQIKENYSENGLSKISESGNGRCPEPGKLVLEKKNWYKKVKTWKKLSQSNSVT